MSTQFDEVERQARALAPQEKAALALLLIDDLDQDTDENVDEIWKREAQRRYDEFCAGKVDARPGPEVMARAQQRLK